VIDLHCHLLPGIDDGPDTMEDSLNLARVAAAGGIRTIVATPHVSREWDNDARSIAALAEDVRGQLAAHGIPLDVRTGAEISLGRAVELPAQELAALALGDGPWLLVECPHQSHAVGLEEQLLALGAQGHRVVLAHPERCPAVQRDPDMLGRLIAAGMIGSVTAGALTGRFGSDVRRFALELVKRGMVHNVASDAHDRLRRPPSIAAELAQAGLEGLGDWASGSVPAAVLAGAPLPPGPPVNPPRPSGPWWQRSTR